MHTANHYITRLYRREKGTDMLDEKGMDMLDIKCEFFQFADVDFYCVGRRGSINVLIQYIESHISCFDIGAFAHHVEAGHIYVFAKPKKLLSFLNCWRFNKDLKGSGLLLDVKMFPEAAFLSDPIQYIKHTGNTNALEVPLHISNYWRERFPDLPEGLVIRRKQQN